MRPAFVAEEIHFGDEHWLDRDYTVALPGQRGARPVGAQRKGARALRPSGLS